jgi:hypothetical protein
MPNMIFSEYILNRLCEKFRSAVGLNHDWCCFGKYFFKRIRHCSSFLSFKGTANPRLEKTSMQVKMKRYPSLFLERCCKSARSAWYIDPECPWHTFSVSGKIFARVYVKYRHLDLQASFSPTSISRRCIAPAERLRYKTPALPSHSKRSPSPLFRKQFFRALTFRLL